MFSLKKAETLPLTKELAEKHLAMTPSPTERPINESRIKWLRDAAKQGDLVTFNWAIAELNGVLYRMNGQHSSKLLSELNGSFPEGLSVHIDTYHVEEKTDLAHLFRQFDARKSARTPSDVSGAYQGLHPDLIDVSRSVAKLAIEGVNWFNRHVEGVPTERGDGMYTLFDDTRYHPFIKWMAEVQGIKTPELQTQPVAAAMYITFETNSKAARDFWPSVAKGGNDEPTDPATVLDNWLERAKSDNRMMNLKPGHLYQGCIYAWNASREQREIKDIKIRIDKGFLTPEH